jgi:hypothetical protein
MHFSTLMMHVCVHAHLVVTLVLLCRKRDGECIMGLGLEEKLLPDGSVEVCVNQIIGGTAACLVNRIALGDVIVAVEGMPTITR